ncbi:MAG: single-stranded DNA-binding protein [Patescibacteria group bacterium]
MRSVNKVIIIGNLTRDPELKQTQNGQSVATFGIATNRDWVTANKERKTSAEFHEVVAWAHLAEICHKYLRKGKLVYLEGYLKTRSWEAETGDKKFRTEIVLQDMIMLEKRGRSEDGGEAEPLSSAPEEGVPEEVPMGGGENQENVF